MGETLTNDRVAIEHLPAGGFRSPARYLRVEGPPGSPLDGFWAEIRSNLLGVELKAIEAARYFYDLHRLMAPYVVAWNYEVPVEVVRTQPAVMAPDGTTEIVPEREVAVVEYESLPPPAEGGPEVFERVDDVVKVWLRAQLLGAPFRILAANAKDETPEGKPSGRAGSTPDGTPEKPIPIGSSRKKSRRAPRSSSTP